MHLRAEAIILSVRAHGEHGAIVRAFTEQEGVQPGYVRGGHGRALRPVLQDALAGLTVELLHSRAAMFSEALPAAAFQWATALSAFALPEGLPYPRLYSALDGVLAAIEAAPAARGWAVAMVRYELLLLAELGFGLDLEHCAATGRNDELAYVSPRSGIAVSRIGAEGYEDRLLRLPRFLVEGGEAGWGDILDGFRLTGHFLERDLLIGKGAELLAARARLVDRLKRAVA
jgi:DNA repair protein RecO (recombination protein O)